jgi:hypothetical protein
MSLLDAATMVPARRLQGQWALEYLYGLLVQHCEGLAAPSVVATP